MKNRSDITVGSTGPCFDVSFDREIPYITIARSWYEDPEFGFSKLVFLKGLKYIKEPGTYIFQFPTTEAFDEFIYCFEPGYRCTLDKNDISLVKERLDEMVDR